jgi:hypothetical protein
MTNEELAKYRNQTQRKLKVRFNEHKKLSKTTNQKAHRLRNLDERNNIGDVKLTR